MRSTTSGAGTAWPTKRATSGSAAACRCVQAHTSQATWTPEDAASLWTRIADPAQEWPEWIQPTGAHNAYAKGAKVTHAGKRWVSDVDANTWEPGVYGWTEHIEEGEA